MSVSTYPVDYVHLCHLLGTGQLSVLYWQGGPAFGLPTHPQHHAPPPTHPILYVLHRDTTRLVKTKPALNTLRKSLR